jgi:hypothetical protein
VNPAVGGEVIMRHFKNRLSRAHPFHVDVPRLRSAVIV